MPNIEHNFFEFRLQPWEKVAGALSSAIDAYEKIANGQDLLRERIYRYIFVVDNEATRPVIDNDPLTIAHRELIRFLDAERLLNFIKNPDDKDNRDIISAQLALIAAATTTYPNVEPYDMPEFEKITKQQTPIYDDVTFLNTLHRVLHGDPETSPLYGEALAASLPTVQPEVETNLYWWDDALIYAAVLQAAWSTFSSLSSLRQQLLIQNYYYQSIVAGVPVRGWLVQYLKNQPAGGNQLIERALENNREFVPLNTSGLGEVRPFIDVIKEYLSSVYTEGISALAQEKVLGNYYRNQTSSDVYSGWLRESLNIIFHLKRQDLVK